MDFFENLLKFRERVKNPSSYYSIEPPSVEINSAAGQQSGRQKNGQKQLTWEERKDKFDAEISDNM